MMAEDRLDNRGLWDLALELHRDSNANGLHIYNELIRVRDTYKDDAEKWRTLISAKRLRIMGSAGFGHPASEGFEEKDPDPRGYRHLGVELWTYHGADEESWARDRIATVKRLEEFIAASRAMRIKVKTVVDVEVAQAFRVFVAAAMKMTGSLSDTNGTNDVFECEVKLIGGNRMRVAVIDTRTDADLIRSPMREKLIKRRKTA